MKKALTVLFIALVAMSFAFAEGAKETSAASGELILYTTVADAQYEMTIAAFNEMYPNIKVFYTYGKP